MDRPNQPARSPYSGPDRRRYPRRAVEVPIELHLEGGYKVLSAETTDLSPNGCYVRLRNPLPVGLWIQATLWLDATPIQVGGRVVTRHPDYGNGIMFLRIQDREEKALAAYLEAVTAQSAI